MTSGQAGAALSEKKRIARPYRAVGAGQESARAAVRGINQSRRGKKRAKPRKSLLQFSHLGAKLPFARIEE
jgi:hypothetical protein